MKNKTLMLMVSTLMVILLFAMSPAQMGRKSGGGRSSYSSPKSSGSSSPKFNAPRSGNSSGMGRGGAFNSPKNNQTTQSGSGMGRSGSYNKTPSPSSGSSSSTRSGNTATKQKNTTSTAPKVGGSTSTQTRIWKTGDRPTSRYERTQVVDGQTRYIYSDGSYSLAATGVIVGYMMAQDGYYAPSRPVIVQQSPMNVFGFVIGLFILVLLAFFMIKMFNSSNKL